MGEVVSDQPTPMVQSAILHAVSMWLATATGSLIVAAGAPDQAKIAAEAAKVLGSPITIQMLMINFSEEDLAALRG
jgi:hypothetical protein